MCILCLYFYVFPYAAKYICIHMYMYMNVYIYAYDHTYTYACIYDYTHLHEPVSMIIPNYKYIGCIVMTITIVTPAAWGLCL